MSALALALPRRTLVDLRVGARALEWLPPSLLALVAFGTYLATLAPTITWRNGGADGAELAAAAYVWGVSHPPGYPLYLTLVRLAQLLPIGDPAYRAALFSAVAAASAALAAYAACRTLLAGLWSCFGWPERLASLFAGASFAFGPLLWSQAVIAEVYTFGALLFGLFLWALLRWEAQPSAARSVAVAGAFALLVSHQPTFAVALPVLVVLGWRRRGPPAVWLGAGAMLLLVPALFSTVWLRASFHPALDWGDPSTPERWFAQVTAASYRSYFLARPVLQELPRIPFALGLLVRQAGWLGGLLGLLGMQALWVLRRQVALVLLALGAFFVAFAVLYNAADGEVYLLPTVEVLAIASGVGAAWLLSAAGRWGRLLVLASLLASVSWQVVAGWPAVDASHDTQARDWGVAALQQAPRNGTLRTRSDDQTFALWYLQAVEGLRPDVEVVEERLLPAAWYQDHLARQYPRLQAGPAS